MIEPYKRRVYDPCCGSAGTLVQSLAFIKTHANDTGGVRPTTGRRDMAVGSFHGRRFSAHRDG